MKTLARLFGLIVLISSVLGFGNVGSALACDDTDRHLFYTDAYGNCMNVEVNVLKEFDNVNDYVLNAICEKEAREVRDAICSDPDYTYN